MDINWEEFLVSLYQACHSGTATGRPSKAMDERFNLGGRPVSYRDEAARSVANTLAVSNVTCGVPIKVAMGWKE